MANKGYTARVREYFDEHPNEHIGIDELTGATNLQRERVQGVISYLIGRDRDITVLSQGRLWICTKSVEHSNNGSKPAETFEFVGTTKDGDVIIRSHGGILYKAAEL